MSFVFGELFNEEIIFSICRIPDLIPEDGPEFSAQAWLHEHVEILPVLEGLVEFDYELAVRLFHDLLLRHDVLLLTRLNDLLWTICWLENVTNDNDNNNL